jgi:hypothetical protein
MSQKDVLHIPLPETPYPDRTTRSEEERTPSVPPIRPSEGSAGTPGIPGHHHHREPRVIEPQPSSIPYPGVGVS